MNWPNRLSLVRVALVPFVAWMLSVDTVWTHVLGLVLFAAAAFTDFLDGHLARKHDIITNFGKFIDPVADKLLVLSTMVALCGIDRLPAWVCIVVLFRELSVDGLRLVAVEQGKVIAAAKLGKYKTASQMMTLIVLMLELCSGVDFPVVPEVLIALVVILTLWSGIEYFVKNKEVILGGEK